MSSPDYQAYRLVIPAGGSVPIQRMGRFIRGLEGTAPYRVQLDSGAFFDMETGIGVPAGEFKRFEVLNKTASEITIVLGVSNQQILDNRMVGNVNITGGIASSGALTMGGGVVAVGVAAVPVVAANALRKQVLFQNHGTVSVFIGGAGVTLLDGIEVKAGGDFVLSVRTAIYAISTLAAQSVRFLQESN